MLDIKFFRENTESVKEKLRTRGLMLDVDKFGELDARRRDLIKETEALEFERNSGSKEVGRLKREGKSPEADVLQAELKGISEKIKGLNDERGGVESELRDFMLGIPNIPHESVPIGRNEDDNEEVRRWGEPTQFDFEPKDHVEIGQGLGILDLDRAAKITGARFALLTGLGARLDRALINFMVDLHTTQPSPSPQATQHASSAAEPSFFHSATLGTKASKTAVLLHPCLSEPRLKNIKESAKAAVAETPALLPFKSAPPPLTTSYISPNAGA